MSEQIALVTGGSAGIGKSICEHLLDDGYTVLN
ncbi:MAG: SDR family NAD(P)-dependent oxidoreductase, partial [Woeseia sp.]|nr:SDR family NAD(P)-dependent oxidoreductase [Woeseia sp.]